jgi:hypothetical protein
MRTKRSLTGPLVLGALLTTTPQLAVGQEDEVQAFIPVLVVKDVRPGTEIQGDRLGEFLAKILTLDFSEEAEPGVGGLLGGLLALRVEVIDREGELVAKYESKAVEVEPGKTYPGSTWFPSSGMESLSFSERRVGFLGFGVWDDYSEEAWTERRECEGATHTLQIGLVSGDERQGMEQEVQALICVTVER